MATPNVLSNSQSGLFSRTYLLQLNGFVPTVLAVLDVVNEEHPEFTADVTRHPVEKGPEITDHIQLKNPTLKLKGTMSNTPLDLSVTLANAAAGAAAVLTSSQARQNILSSGLSQATSLMGSSLLEGAAISSAGGAAFAGAVDAISRAILLNAYEQRLPFNVITKRQLFQNMVIERLAFPRDSSTGYQLAFEIDMIQVRIVSPLTIQFTNVSDDVSTTASDPTDLGGQSSQGASTSAQTSVNQSWLKSISAAAGH